MYACECACACASQCPEEDEKAFQDISKHRFFNTNNLWINLAALKARSPAPHPTTLCCESLRPYVARPYNPTLPEPTTLRCQSLRPYAARACDPTLPELAALRCYCYCQAVYEKFDGVLPLPVISNGKTVDPRDKASTQVLQLETAMGSAIECFPGAQAILIPRSRFAPVKTTSDMLALASDACVPHGL